MADKLKETLKASAFETPEDIFERTDLTHKSNEIERFIRRFDAAAQPKPVYSWVKELLIATVNFRAATEPQGTFYILRNAGATDEELKEFLEKMAAIIITLQQKLQTDINVEDKNILRAALAYCKKSIRKRMASLDSDDRLLPFWDDSELKKNIETN